jgi:TonB family protein
VNASKKEKDTDSDKEVVVVGYAKSRTEGSIKIAGPEGSDNPLFIVNGIKTSRKDLEGIDPNTIDAIAVLKDQSSVAVYGEEGKNGVIIVTTKKAENKNSNEPVEVIGYSQQQGNVKVDSTFTKVDEMPVYPGGDKALLEYITSNIKYPESLRAQKITGKVYVRFAVSAEGKTEQVSILKGVHPALDAEAYRVVSSLKGWTPAKREGKPVSVWYMVPVEFSLLDASRTLVPQDKPGSSGMSRDSELEILKFLGQNSQYPYAARKDGVTGKIFVKVTVANGKIRSNASPSKEEDMNVPFLPEVVIVGYRSNDANPNDLRPDPKGRAASNASIDVLEKEAERVIAMLKQVDVPELKKDGEFGVVLNYTLK